MSSTQDLTLVAATWTLVATDPPPMRIRCNSQDFNSWAVFVTDDGQPPSESAVGELLQGREYWETGGMVGSVYIRGDVGLRFAVVSGV